MRLTIILLLAATLTACANMAEVSNKIAGLDGVEITQGEYGEQLLESYTVKGRGASDADLPFCIAKSIQNNDVTITDSSRSFVGAYTGRYYQAGSTVNIGGGSVLTYVSVLGDKVVAQGTTSYRSGGLVERSVRFQLTAASQEDLVTLIFSPIEQAQLDTGAIANKGYYRVGAWDGASPDLVIAALSRESDKIINCLRE